MAHTKSARKRIRQGQKRAFRNQSVKTHIKGLARKLRATTAESGAEEMQIVLKDVIRAVDKAVSKGILHHRTGSRKISRLSRMVHRRIAPGQETQSASS